MNCRYKLADGGNRFPHILNGSGTALARLFVALIETHQQADGSVSIPSRCAPTWARTVCPPDVLPMRILLASSEIFPYSKSGGRRTWWRRWPSPGRGGTPGRGGHAALRRHSRTFSRIASVDWRMQLPGRQPRERVGLGGRAGGEPHLYFIDQPGFSASRCTARHRELHNAIGLSFCNASRTWLDIALGSAGRACERLARRSPTADQASGLDRWMAVPPPRALHPQPGLPGCLRLRRLRCPISWSYFTADGAEFHGQFNCLKTGLVSSGVDREPELRREIQTPTTGAV